MIKIIFTTIFTRMTIQELLIIIKILINFIRKKSAGIQRHRVTQVRFKRAFQLLNPFNSFLAKSSAMGNNIKLKNAI